ncbi:hypothetical protein A3L09_01475 [Thermococcus profundus]|uniref:Uncharacterized protein n=1 Tax=Thermococcus profundus TaxID=49899 RepID=A0A2Z2M771_THEPR|nr:hypothetical protein [Thermococcus profundus]ASJ02027.1 hypothetical protein A3L09_01475 [Thermococcus profundus]
MAVKAETGKEVTIGLVAILLTLLFVLFAFLLHNVVWIVVGMLFTVGFALYAAEAHGIGFFSKPKAGS